MDLFEDPTEPEIKPASETEDEEEVPVFSDGVRADSPEGIRRALENLKEIRRRLQGMNAARALWRGKASRRLAELNRRLATGIYPEDTVRSMRAEKLRLERELARAERPMREWDFSRGRPKEPEPEKEHVEF